ncbi:MAG: hypothetical protein AABZ84_08390 [Pseudomonadota bacterium]
MRQMMTYDDLSEVSASFRDTGGVSEENRSLGFRPAFFNRDNGRFLMACNAEGTPAAVHQFDGLPDDWVAGRDQSGRPVAVKASVVAGFVRGGCFYTREQAAQLVQWELDKLAC